MTTIQKRGQFYHPINGGLALTAVEIFLLAP